MQSRFAVIDLGTNTFHLLVAEKRENHLFKALHRQRFFVKLAEDGIETIGKEPMQRGFDALNVFKAVLNYFKIEQVKAIGTAALRTASNGQEFIEKVKVNYGINIELIDGNREAELIYKGVVLAYPLNTDNHLIMDIGGGSVEFIIANNNGILWAQSFPIGVGVLYKKFHHAEPISNIEIADLQTFLAAILHPLFTALEKFPTKILIGASGTFDVLEAILTKEKIADNYAFVEVTAIEPLHQLLLNATKEERFAMQNIPDSRADMIVVAMILIDFIIKKVAIEKVVASHFAMKEGILVELTQLSA